MCFTACVYKMGSYGQEIPLCELDFAIISSRNLNQQKHIPFLITTVRSICMISWQWITFQFCFCFILIISFEGIIKSGCYQKKKNGLERMLLFLALWLVAAAGHEASCEVIGWCHNGWAERGGTFKARNREVRERKKRVNAGLLPLLSSLHAAGQKQTEK